MPAGSIAQPAVSLIRAVHEVLIRHCLFELKLERPAGVSDVTGHRVLAPLGIPTCPLLACVPELHAACGIARGSRQN